MKISWGIFGAKRPTLSVVVVFYNMRREAKRTLYTLTSQFQQGIKNEDYEVIIIDSGSSEPLSQEWVEGIQDNFRYCAVETDVPSPCKAMNVGIDLAKAEHVVCMIDGARMLSPSILSGMLRGFAAYPNAYVYTFALHLGEKLQYVAMLEDGYCQDVEDLLLESIPWQTDGYQLFDISCPSQSSGDGYVNIITESNCFAVSKNTLKTMGGFDERFRCKGGGLVNLDLHLRLTENRRLEPILLLGEGSFHQFHGGVATNAQDLAPVIAEFAEEYLKIRGEPYRRPEGLPRYFGKIHPRSRRFLDLVKGDPK